MGSSVPAPAVELVKRFERDRKAFLSSDHKEGLLPKARTQHGKRTRQGRDAATGGCGSCQERRMGTSAMLKEQQ